MSKTKTVPKDYDELSVWFNVLRSIRSKSTTGGPAIVSINVVVDGYGKPARLWTEVEVKRLFPTDSAECVIETIVEGLTK